jgi:polyribonucleotide nucleotidyltransferase
MPWTPPVKDTALESAVGAFAGELEEVVFTAGKHARSGGDGRPSRDRCLEKLTAGITDEKQLAARKKAVKGEFGELVSKLEREMILRGQRLDGRKPDEVRRSRSSRTSSRGSTGPCSSRAARRRRSSA